MSAKDDEMTTLAKKTACETTTNAVNSEEPQLDCCDMEKDYKEMAAKIKV